MNDIATCLRRALKRCFSGNKSAFLISPRRSEVEPRPLIWSSTKGSLKTDFSSDKEKVFAAPLATVHSSLVSKQHFLNNLFSLKKIFK